MDVDDAGQYMCIITASYTGSEVNTTYVMNSMNTASAYLTVKRKLVEIICISTVLLNFFIIKLDRNVRKSY